MRISDWSSDVCSSDLAEVWDIEFQAEPTALGVDAGLLAIDHVAQTMNYEEMLTWLLFYTSIFRTGKLPMVDVVDPAGLVRSQVVERDDGSLRLTRSEGRRVGQECVSTCRSRLSPFP